MYINMQKKYHVSFAICLYEASTAIVLQCVHEFCKEFEEFSWFFGAQLCKHATHLYTYTSFIQNHIIMGTHLDMR